MSHSTITRDDAIPQGDHVVPSSTGEVQSCTHGRRATLVLDATGQPASLPFAGVHVVAAQELTAQESIAVDARQDELMAIESVAGRPPSHWLRRIEWRSVAIGLPMLVVGAGAWALFRGVSVGAIIGLGIAACLLMLLGGWPVLAAGLLREKDETAARAEAIAELPSRRT